MTNSRERKSCQTDCRTLKNEKKINFFLFIDNFPDTLRTILDPALNAENIKADRGKILTPTHFSDPKDINAETWGVGVVP